MAENNSKPFSSSFNNVFALIIGIEEYKSPVLSKGIERLPGSLVDVSNVVSFLTETLGVPTDNVLALKNGTRDEIIASFQKHLIDNENIPKSDAALLFYYSGHGARVNIPEGWPILETPDKDGKLEQKSEVLIPSDCAMHANEDGTASVEAIPDRTINALLVQAAEKHGDNITVILDCCFSAHLTRNATQSNDPEDDMWVNDAAAIRLIPEEFLPPLRPDTDQDIWHTDADLSASKQRGGLAKNLRRLLGDSATRSHVLLAACSRQQEARVLPVGSGKTRGSNGGCFTTFLLQTLSQAHQKTLRGKPWPTYEDIMRDVQTTLRPLFLKAPKKLQTPEASGWLITRPVFKPFADVRRFRARKSTFKAGPKNRRIIVSAGHLHAIAHDTEFTLYNGIHSVDALATGLRPSTSSPIAAGSCEISLLQDLKIPDDLTYDDLDSLYVCITSTRTGRPLKVHISPQAKEILDDLHETDLNLEAEPENSDLIIEVEAAREQDTREYIENQVGLKFTRKDRLLRQDRKAKLEWTEVLTLTKRETDSLRYGMSKRLHVIALFNFHLHHQPSGSPRSYFQNVEVNFGVFPTIATSKKEYETLTDSTLTARTLNEAGDYDVDVDPDQQYGVVIKNNTKEVLFFYVVFFDPSTYAVTVWYQPANDQAFVSSGATLQLGHSDSLSEPLQFEHGVGQEHDIGFMKVYMMPKYTDLSVLNQEGMYMEIHRKDEVMELSDTAVGDDWDFVRLRVISQKKLSA